MSRQTLLSLVATALIFWACPAGGPGAGAAEDALRVRDVLPHVPQGRGADRPHQIFDMQTRAGNPLHEQYVRNNVRFGIKAMPAFRLSEVSPKELDEIVAYMKAVAAYRKIHPEYKPAPTQEGGAKK